MNDKIRALAVQSVMVFLNDNNRCVSSFIEDTDITDYVEEFANLIVKEYIKQCRLVQSQILVGMNTDFYLGKDMGMEVCIDAIKEHFGIE